MNVNFVVDFNKPMYPCRQFLLKGDRQFDNVGLMSTLMTTFIVNVTILIVMMFELFILSCCSSVLFICFVALKTLYVCPRLVGSIILSIVCSCPRKGKPGGGESMSEPDVESSSSAPATLPCPTHPCAFSSRDESLAVHVSAAANPNTAERCRPLIFISTFSNPQYVIHP